MHRCSDTKYSFRGLGPFYVATTNINLIMSEHNLKCTERRPIVLVYVGEQKSSRRNSS